MSISTGTAPAISMAATVATAVCDTVATAQPGPMPRPRNASASASVPLPQPTACAVPSQAANSASNAAPLGAEHIPAGASARATAASISACSAR